MSILRIVPTLVLVPALALTLACGSRQADDRPSPASVSAAASPAPGPPVIDRSLDDRFAYVAGVPTDSAGAAPWQDDPSWRDYAGRLAEVRSDFDTHVLGPMRAWSAAELAEARGCSATLFSPFSGPELPPVFALFPEARRIVLMGLEPVGNLPDPGRGTAAQREAFFLDLEMLLSEYYLHGYFITAHMNDVYSRGKVDGALPIMAYFLKSEGCAVLRVRRLIPDGGGGFLDMPYEQSGKRPQRPNGVRIDYLKPGDPAARSVYYFSCDVENKAFPESSPLFQFFDGLGDVTTFVKAGSYLLHWDTFSNLRGLMLRRSLFILQDDTSIPYRFLTRLGWEVRLYGRYGAPVKDFTNVEQPDLKAAFDDPKGEVRPLPFGFGYHWRTRLNSLLLAKRPIRALAGLGDK